MHGQQYIKKKIHSSVTFSNLVNVLYSQLDFRHFFARGSLDLIDKILFWQSEGCQIESVGFH